MTSPPPNHGDRELPWTGLGPDVDRGRSTLSAVKRPPLHRRDRTTATPPPDETTTTTSSDDPRQPSRKRQRVVLAAVVAVCMAVTGIAVTAGDNSPQGLEFTQAGHWVYNDVLGKVFHVDGGSKDVDGEIPIPGTTAGKVVQTDRHGYVLSKDRIIKFGKSNLSVADPIDPPANETPIGLESAGVAYAIYPLAGKIVRFGDRLIVASAGGRLGTPVTTSDGTLWVHLVDNGKLCQLPLDATRLSCIATTQAGHHGGLTLLDDGQPAFLDTTADTVSTITDDGFGRTANVGTDLADSSVIAANGIDGQTPVLDPDRPALRLVDTSAAVQGRPVQQPRTTPLPAGDYRQVASSGTAVAVIEERSGTVLTMGSRGEMLTKAKIPAPSAKARDKASDDDRPVLFRGDDKRLYVDSVGGEHVLVVDEEGKVTPVKATRDPDETTKSPLPSRSMTPNPARSGRSPGDQQHPSGDQTNGKPLSQADEPGAPGGVSGKAGENKVTVNWDPAAGNGAPVTNYRLSWNGGSKSVPADTTKATVDGLKNGTSYTVSVRAVNRAGAGPAASTGPLTPAGPAAAPKNFQVQSAGDGDYQFTWNRPNMGGGKFMSYFIVKGDEDDNANSSTESYTWSGLDEGETYHFTVQAVTTVHGEMTTGKTASLTFTA